MGKWGHCAERSYLLIRSLTSGFCSEATNLVTQELVTPKYRATSNLAKLGIAIEFHK